VPPFGPLRNLSTDNERCPHPSFHEDNSTLNADLKEISDAIDRVVAANHEFGKDSNLPADSLRYLQSVPQEIRSDMSYIENLVDGVTCFLVRKAPEQLGSARGPAQCARY
jgi:hypothetical protein